MLWHAQLHIVISEGARIAFNTDVRYLWEPFVKPDSLLCAPPEPPPPSIKALS
jgi:hypothetical protein